MRFLIHKLTLLAAVLSLSGCVFKPRESTEQIEAINRDAQRFGYETDHLNPRPLEDLSSDPKWQDILHRAFLANGELAARYYEWSIAVQKIDQAGIWPDQPIEIGFEYMFSGDRMKSFDRTTTSIGLMDSSSMPIKAYASAKIAWREAQAAGERFRAAKFILQKQVLQAWTDYYLLSEKVRIQNENLNLLRLVSTAAASRVRAGGAQQEQLNAEVEMKMAENELTSTKVQLDQQRATLNAFLRRDPDATLPATFESRNISIEDQRWIDAGVLNNSELSAMGFDELARKDAIDRVKLEYLPEINLAAAFTGSISQTAGAAIVLPSQWQKVDAMITESRSDLRRIQSVIIQAKADRVAQFYIALLTMRDAERRIKLIDSEILPLASRSVDLSRQSYASGTSSYLELIASQRTLLTTQFALAEAKAAREKMLAELEMLAGVDAEKIASETNMVKNHPEEIAP